MALEMRIFFYILLLLVHAANMIYARDDQSDFISIDCGSPPGTKYTQDDINYVSDDGFIESGENQNISNRIERFYNTLRRFPENKRNCYTLIPRKGKNNKYLIRANFFYGNSRGDQPPKFDLYIGADYWTTVSISNGSIPRNYEIIHLTSSDFIHVCLVNTGHGHPFITTLELRVLDITMYEVESRSLNLYCRSYFGADQLVRYIDDKYDRVWYPLKPVGCRTLQTSNASSLNISSKEKVPLKIMSTAVTPINSTDDLTYSCNPNSKDDLIIYFHFVEVEVLESSQKREFVIYNNDIPMQTFSPSTDITTISKEISVDSTTYGLKLRRTLNSTLPPILNAIEVYSLMQFLQNQTYDQDVAAIWSIMKIYGLKRLNWQGDPCVPEAWVGLNCNYDEPRATRITSLNLSSKGLSGGIPTVLANLTMIESLDLSYNKFTGHVPKFLAQLENLKTLNLRGNNFTRPLPAELVAKSKDGSLSLSIEGSSCFKSSCKNNKHKLVVILATITGCVVILCIIVFVVKRLKRKANLINKDDEVFIPRKQQFVYSELVDITNNFENEIGRGGFGRVFLGTVGNNKNVAVKMLSESSSQGYKEFQAEVKLLMEIHHKNITSLIGYCDDNNHKGIIYDYMANGSLEKHLFDGCPNVLSWDKRLQIGCDAAEGLAYMHHGCRPPIVHRDVKSSNILLNEGFQAKLADFGLSRAFPTEDASHVTTEKFAGTKGFLDPEYWSTNRLTEKSDVYSFGVVLLELITSRRAISQGINITKWVKSPIDQGDVEKIIDPRLEGRFDINTAWKVVEIAMECVSHTSVERPTMNSVAMDLKQCVHKAKDSQLLESESMSLNLESVTDPNPR